MATTEHFRNGTGNVDSTFDFEFPYLNKADIVVKVLESGAWATKAETTHYTFPTVTSIKFVAGQVPASGSNNIHIYRNTSSDTLAATFYPGSAIRASDLNNNYTQNLYVTQEASNAVTDANTDATAALTKATTADSNATTALNNSRESDGSGGYNTAISIANTAKSTADSAAADVAAAVLYTSVANKAALEALTPSEDGYYEVKDSSSLANATWGTPTYTLSGIPGTYPSSALDGITTRLSFTVSNKTFAYTAYTVNDADNRYLSSGDILDEDNMATNSATKVASQQSVKAYADLKAPLASPTFTGTVAIPNIANVETAITAKAPLASPTFTGTVAIPNIANLETAVAANTAKVTNVTTNLSVTANGTSLTVASSDGTDASIPAVTTSAWGAMTDEDKTKLDGIATGATANAGDAVKSSNNAWTGVNSNTPETLTSAATITIDFSTSNNFKLETGHSAIAFDNPTTEIAGASGSIFITQGSTTCAAPTWGDQFLFAGGTAPSLTGTTGKIARIDYIVQEAGKIHCVATDNLAGT